MSERKLPDKKQLEESGKALMQGAMSLFGGGPSTPAPAPPSSAKKPASGAVHAVEKSPLDIPKEELMTLCMKLNKRMQSLEHKGQELTKKKSSLVEERRQLVDLISSTISMNLACPDEENLNVDVVRDSWRAYTSQQLDKVVQLEQQVTDSQQLVEKTVAKLEAKHRRELAEAVAGNSQQSSSSLSPRKDDTPNGGNGNSGAPSSSGATGEETADAMFLKTELERLTAENVSLQSNAKEIQGKFRKGELDIERLTASDGFLRGQISNLEAELKEKSDKIAALQKDVEDSRAKKEEAVLHLQMQLNSTKTREDGKEKEVEATRKQLQEAASKISSLQLQIEEKDMSVKSNRDVIKALQGRLAETEPQVEKSKHRIVELERNAMAGTVLKAEQEALLGSLRKDLKAALERGEDGSKRMRELEEYKMKTDGQLMKQMELSEELEQIRSTLEDKAAMITRLREEAAAAGRTHAMRTAMLATCEEQIESLKQEIILKEATAKECMDRVHLLQDRVTGLEKQLLDKQAEYKSKVEKLLKEKEDIRITCEKTLEEERKKDELALDALKRDFAKKSTTARALLTEREGEIRVLQTKNKRLDEEIKSGAPSERKIFSLAEEQAKRDALYSIHSDSREMAFQKLQTTLAARDLNLAELQRSHAALTAEVSELRRTAKREGVNMDYLKNVVLQYMSFPLQAPERASLIPVMGMLLQFNKRCVENFS
jgi:chromosome segregation ATPase